MFSLAVASYATVYNGIAENPVPVQDSTTASAPTTDSAAVEAVAVPEPEAAPETVKVATAEEVSTPAATTAEQPAPAPVAAPVKKTAVTSKNVPVAATYENRNNHNSFFFGINIGARYTKLSYQQYEEYFDEDSKMWVVGDKGNSTSRRFKGLGPDIGLKFGGVVASRLALYCNLELSSLDGKYKATRTENGTRKARADFETDAVRFAIGGGSSFFLNNDTNSAFYGLFAGISASIMFEDAGLTSTYYDHEELEISESGIAFGLELGKIWRISDSWNAGIVGKATLDGSIRDGDSGNSSDCYTVALGLTVMRK